MHGALKIAGDRLESKLVQDGSEDSAVSTLHHFKWIDNHGRMNSSVISK